MPRSSRLGFGLRVVYEDGRGVLREVIAGALGDLEGVHEVATTGLADVGD